jgi:hypothetical protein
LAKLVLTPVATHWSNLPRQIPPPRSPSPSADAPQNPALLPPYTPPQTTQRPGEDRVWGRHHVPRLTLGSGAGALGLSAPPVSAPRCGREWVCIPPMSFLRHSTPHFLPSSPSFSGSVPLSYRQLLPTRTLLRLSNPLPLTLHIPCPAPGPRHGPGACIPTAIPIPIAG